MSRSCDWCREPIGFLEPQTASWSSFWHTRCWNESAAERAAFVEEMDNADGFSIRFLPDELIESETGARRSEVMHNYMATQPNRPPREIVDFPANTPVTVALKYAQGKTISNQYGERILFSLADGRIMFLDLEVAGQIEKLGINVGENFSITRKWDGQKGSWEIARVAGEQPNGTLVVAAVPSKPAGSAISPVNGTRKSVGGTPLVEEAQGLVDAYAAVREYARETYGGQIKSAEVRAFVTTAYIQRGRSVA